MDYLKVTIIVLIIALVIVLSCAATITWNNLGSRNLALATGTLAAAMLLFILQLRFELTEFKDQDFVSVEYTIDRKTPGIRQWVYPERTPGWRLPKEVEASDNLASINSKAFQDREKVNSDFVVFSLLSFFGTALPDWQLKTTRFKGSSIGSITRTQRVSTAADSTQFDGEALKKLLSKSGNIFTATSPTLGGSVLLPPKSLLSVTANQITIENPFCRTILTVEPSGSVTYYKPGKPFVVGKDSLEPMPDGDGRYETRITGIKIETTYSTLRAQHQEMTKYKDWNKRVADGLREWFETNPSS